MLRVYHGATCTIEGPLCNAGRRNLDFGCGFYLTDLREQAARWALRQAAERDLPPLLNIYELDMDCIHTTYRYLRFEAYDLAWLDFIADSRLGREPWRGYDYIEGGIADDRVINTIEDYLNGDIPADFALRRLAQHQPNNQMCLLSQSLIDECLHYVGCEPVSFETMQKGGTPC